MALVLPSVTGKVSKGGMYFFGVVGGSGLATRRAGSVRKRSECIRVRCTRPDRPLVPMPTRQLVFNRINTGQKSGVVLLETNCIRLKLVDDYSLSETTFRTFLSSMREKVLFSIEYFERLCSDVLVCRGGVHVSFILLFTRNSSLKVLSRHRQKDPL